MQRERERGWRESKQERRAGKSVEGTRRAGKSVEEEGTHLQVKEPAAMQRRFTEYAAPTHGASGVRKRSRSAFPLVVHAG